MKHVRIAYYPMPSCIAKIDRYNDGKICEIFNLNDIVENPLTSTCFFFSESASILELTIPRTKSCESNKLRDINKVCM